LGSETKKDGLDWTRRDGVEKSVHHEAFYHYCLNNGKRNASGITADRWRLQVRNWIGADQKTP
jgi:hypothetical protein